MYVFDGKDYCLDFGRGNTAMFNTCQRWRKLSRSGRAQGFCSFSWLSVTEEICSREIMFKRGEDKHSVEIMYNTYN